MNWKNILNKKMKAIFVIKISFCFWLQSEIKNQISIKEENNVIKNKISNLRFVLNEFPIEIILLWNFIFNFNRKENSIINKKIIFAYKSKLQIFL